MTAFKGKSFKVGWDKGFKFYSLSENDGNGSLFASNIVCGTTKHVDPLQVSYLAVQLFYMFKLFKSIFFNMWCKFNCGELIFTHNFRI